MGGSKRDAGEECGPGPDGSQGASLRTPVLTPQPFPKGPMLQVGVHIHSCMHLCTEVDTGAWKPRTYTCGHAHAPTHENWTQMLTQGVLSPNWTAAMEGSVPRGYRDEKWYTGLPPRAAGARASLSQTLMTVIPPIAHPLCPGPHTTVLQSMSRKATTAPNTSPGSSTASPHSHPEEEMGEQMKSPGRERVPKAESMLKSSGTPETASV